MSNLAELKKDLESLSDPYRAKMSLRFFKTGKGEYGEGDTFLGVSTPQQRLIAKKHQELTLADIEKLLHTDIHEYRFTALVILNLKFAKADESDRKIIFDLYIKNAKKINNWDLVDCSAPNIVGAYLLSKKIERDLLYRLAKSDNLWEKRIAMLATFTFIRHNQYDDALQIAEILLPDKHDLIHKAVGWMLREVGNRSRAAEELFLDKHISEMSRTTLRYAIEKFDKVKREYYLHK